MGETIETARSAGNYARDLAGAFNHACKLNDTHGIFHPVLIFGSSMSGKTMALVSMLSYAQTRSAATIDAKTMFNLDYPNSHPDAAGMKDWANDFFNNTVNEFSKHWDRMPTYTRKQYPFFIPVRAMFDRHKLPSSGGLGAVAKLGTKTIVSDKVIDGVGPEDTEAARFVFLESNGELIHKPDGALEFPELPVEIVNILKFYTNAISVIFVAPAVEEGGLTGRAFQEAHLNLQHCIKRFEHHRQDVSKDNVLLLVSKWDARYPPARFRREFAQSGGAEVVEALGDFKSTFQVFSTLQLHEDAKAFTPYSGTWIVGGERKPEGELAPVFDKFNRTVWNWLYGNVFSDVAKNGQGQGNGHGTQRPPRKNFYDDVTQAGPASRPWAETAVAFILRISRAAK